MHLLLTPLKLVIEIDALVIDILFDLTENNFSWSFLKMI